MSISNSWTRNLTLFGPKLETGDVTLRETMSSVGEWDWLCSSFFTKSELHSTTVTPVFLPQTHENVEILTILSHQIIYTLTPRFLTTPTPLDSTGPKTELTDHLSPRVLVEVPAQST